MKCGVRHANTAKEQRGNFDGFGLSNRELEILHWMGECKSNPEIGLILGVSPNTVRKHIQHIFPKIGVETRVAAARLVWDLKVRALVRDG